MVTLRVVSYGYAQVGVATADTPCGPYSYRGSFNPLGAQSRDESVFLDGNITIALRRHAPLTVT